jgi:hypothetical protein
METESGVETDGDPDGDQGAAPYDSDNYYVDSRLSVPGGWGTQSDRGLSKGHAGPVEGVKETSQD